MSGHRRLFSQARYICVWDPAKFYKSFSCFFTLNITLMATFFGILTHFSSKCSSQTKHEVRLFGDDGGGGALLTLIGDLMALLCHLVCLVVTLLVVLSVADTLGHLAAVGLVLGLVPEVFVELFYFAFFH